VTADHDLPLLNLTTRLPKFVNVSVVMSPMRVAIAGTCGLAQFIANLLATQSYHTFIVLSRNVSRSFPFDSR
jgi:hypothetical protein